MALVKFGGGVAGLSGKIEGTVFARNKAGAYARNWAKPTNPVTPKQSAVRGLFQQGNAAWRGLTQAQRDAWEALAASSDFLNRIGESMKLSGIALFMKSYQNIASSNRVTVDPVATPTNAPADVLAPAPPLQYEFTVTNDSGTVTLPITSSEEATVPTGISFIVEATPGLPSSKNNANLDFRYIATVAGDEDWNGADLQAEYIAELGEPPVGSVVQLRVKALNQTNGMVSGYLLTKPQTVTDPTP